MTIKPPTTAEAIWKACDTAMARRRTWDADMEGVYDLILVYREPVGRSGASGRRERAYDSTAIGASMRFAGRLKNDIAPALQEFFQLQPGPAAKAGMDEAKLEKFERVLQRISKATHAAIDTGPFHNAMNEMCIDLIAGQGAMLISEGDEDEPVIYETAPATDVYLTEGRGGRVVEIHYPREWTLREIGAKWPKSMPGGKDGRKLPSQKHVIPAAAAKLIAEGGEPAEAKRQVRQCTMWDGEKKRWRLSVVMAAEGEKGKESYVTIHESETRTCPWLTPRFFKVPGEATGRGPAMLALPDVRVANKTVELTLRAAALAIMGLWTRTTTLNAGGTLNLNRLAPGSMIPVTSNGGTRGREIEALDVPRNFDVSNILLADYRDRIREMLFDRQIPSSKGQTPLSASQVIEHIRVYAEDLAVVYGRFVLEIIIPLVQRVMEILYRQQILPEDIKIDQLVTQVKVVSALADAQNMKDLQRVVQWLELMNGLLGREIALLGAKAEDLPKFMAKKLGVSVELARDAIEKKDFQEVIAQLVIAQQQAAGAMPPPQGGPSAPV